MLNKVKLTGVKFTAEGTMQRIELNGPATYALWTASWYIFQNIMLMLDQVDLGKLMSYKLLMDQYYEQHGDSHWAALYQADVRVRSELFGRSKREGIEARNKAFNDLCDMIGDSKLAQKRFKHAYTPDRPWDYVFGRILSKEMRSTWWFQELDLPILKNNQMRGKGNVSNLLDGDVRINRPTGKGNSTFTPPPPDVTGYTSTTVRVKQEEPKQKKQKTNITEKVHNVVDGHHQTTRTNKPLCWAWSSGGCFKGKGIVCPKHPGRVHLCSRCLDWRHPASECEKAEPEEPEWYKSINADNGKNTGGKGGKGKRGKKQY